MKCCPKCKWREFTMYDQSGGYYQMQCNRCGWILDTTDVSKEVLFSTYNKILKLKNCLLYRLRVWLLFQGVPARLLGFQMKEYDN